MKITKTQLRKIIREEIQKLSVNESTDWMLKLDIGKNNPDEFKKWASPRIQRKHKIKVRGSGKKWIIVGDEKKGSSSDWIKRLLDKAWTINKIKTQQIESVKEGKLIKSKLREMIREEIYKIKRGNTRSSISTEPLTEVKVQVYDNGGKTADRYIVIIDRDVYTMSDNPLSPQGINMYAGILGRDIRTGSHLGKKLGSVPSVLKKAIKQKMAK